MNEIDARKLASKAVKEELKRLDEFKGYPDWFLEKLLTCK